MSMACMHHPTHDTHTHPLPALPAMQCSVFTATGYSQMLTRGCSPGRYSPPWPTRLSAHRPVSGMAMQHRSTHGPLLQRAPEGSKCPGGEGAGWRYRVDAPPATTPAYGNRGESCS